MLALAGPACGADDDQPDSPTPGGGASAEVHELLCASARAASSGDPGAADRHFEDAHTALHDLAAAAEEEDRPVAARLLEAKQQVESGGGPRARAALAAAAADAIAATGAARPPPCAG